ncbi:hypothetical protein Jinkies_52 [Arthrobacter phage Jinkies]|uniref:RusA-like resolvase n=1 Tax=Arthrobacter phage Jinkies TaxID=2743903 RepID=A0A7S6BFZ9_9CAUD|nr:hypothetical protein Jinkies_52 [Arthrobacter phage Jinkies]
MTPPNDTTQSGRRHEAALDRLRAKGNHLAPVMVDGRVRPKGSKQSAASGAETGVGRPVAPELGQSPHPVFSEATASAFPGSVFELVIPAPAEFLNANQRLDRWEKARRVKAWRREACRLAGFASLPGGISQLQVDAYVIKPVANNYDPANYQDTAKPVLDGLIDYGLAQDDNRKIVTGPFMHDGGKGEPALRVVVTVLEVMVA